ncbi:hypothetical protein BBP40_010495 [Aspergillus hancockii]|nr:hypothetical protein BBP40_010495 [Aspergillus hancockii]
MSDALKRSSPPSDEPGKEVDRPVSDSQQNVRSESGIVSDELGGIRLVAVTVAFMLSILIIAMDQDILSTAIPKITSHFGTTNDIGWWGSAYLLAQMAFQPPFGRIYIYFHNKRTFQLSLIIFCIGSIICATAVSSIIFTVGRAISGIGAAGISSGAFAIGSRVVPIMMRPLYLSLVGSMEGISSIAGPLLGGVFAESRALTWRFIFWINLPIASLAMAAVTFLMKDMSHRDCDGISPLQKLIRLDLQGAIILIGSSVCLVFALHSGYVVYPWSDSRVWGCLMGAGLLAIAFIGWEAYRGTEAIFPARVVFQRSMGLGAVYLALNFMIIFVHAYYLPLYFQVVQRQDAEQSGIRLLPYLVPAVFAAIVSGIFISKTGFYVPIMWIGSTLLTIGCGLLYTLKPGSPARHWVGYQVLTSVGFGLVLQVPYTVVQAVLKPEDVPMGNAFLLFSMGLGGSIALSIGQNIFSTTLVRQLSKYPSLANLTGSVLGIGATDLGSVVSHQNMKQLIDIYSHAITQTFLLPVCAGALAFFFSLGMERKRLHERRNSMVE